jgi:hypothetical protein
MPVQIRKNCDTVWIFAGMTDKLVFGMIMNEFGLNFKDLWDTYSELKLREVLIIDFIARYKNKNNRKLIYKKVLS